MKKAAFIILGILLCLFGFAQVLQLLGLIGTKTFSLAGIAAALIGFTLGAICFKQAGKSH